MQVVRWSVEGEVHSHARADVLAKFGDPKRGREGYLQMIVV